MRLQHLSRGSHRSQQPSVLRVCKPRSGPILNFSVVVSCNSQWPQQHIFCGCFLQLAVAPAANFVWSFLQLAVAPAANVLWLFLATRSGPSSSLFVTEEELAEMEFVTMVVGDESSQLQQQKGYDGQDTIAYRSTKVRLWVF